MVRIQAAAAGFKSMALSSSMTMGCCKLFKPDGYEYRQHLRDSGNHLFCLAENKKREKTLAIGGPVGRAGKLPHHGPSVFLMGEHMMNRYEYRQSTGGLLCKLFKPEWYEYRQQPILVFLWPETTVTV